MENINFKSTLWYWYHMVYLWIIDSFLRRIIYHLASKCKYSANYLENTYRVNALAFYKRYIMLSKENPFSLLNLYIWLIISSNWHRKKSGDFLKLFCRPFSPSLFLCSLLCLLLTLVVIFFAIPLLGCNMLFP